MTITHTKKLLDPDPRLISRKLMARDSFKPAGIVNTIAAAWIQFENHNWFFHGNGDPDKVIDALPGIEAPNLTGGVSKMLPNHHITKPVFIGEIRADAKKFGDERRTVIEEAGRAVVERQVIDEALTIIVSKNRTEKFPPPRIQTI
mgnify:CR=1 FL=1